ncbi:hypothetical protein LDENG_00166390 [Lucifuga dentata]|nr:hypothetical protein LDENG_00166390 [Lucifuga dentata]
MDLTGNLKAIYGEDEIKHTYEVNYADRTANAKCSTTESLRFDHTICASIVPFDFNLDAISNAEGDLTMYGKQSARLYGKLLLRAQPLAFASSHECRASVSQQLNNGFSMETTIDNKMDTVLSPQEQKAVLILKSKMNEHAFNQDISVYNTVEKTGMELSGTILTSILNTDSTDNQEFTISGFLKYDKNTSSHIIQFPLIESLPAVLENIKVFVVSVVESFQNFINNEEVRAKFELLPQYMSEFVAQLNVEGKIIQLKQYLNDLTQEYVFSVEDVEATLSNLKLTFEKLLADLTTYIQNVFDAAKEMIVNAALPEALIQKFQEQLNAINEEYDIKGMAFAVIDMIRDLIQQIDIEKLKGTSIAFLHDIDTKFEVKAKLQLIMDQMRGYIETFDMSNLAAELKSFISSFNFKAHIEELVGKIVTDVFKYLTNFVKKINEDFDILGKINNCYAKMRELIVKFEADKKVVAILDKVLELIRQFKIEETIMAMGNILKDMDIPAKLMQVMQDAINYLKEAEIKEIIEQLNVYFDTIVQKLKSFEYNVFVDQINEMIAKYTASVNEWIRTLEIPQKLAVTRDFVNFCLSSVRSFMEQLREIKVADMIKSVKDILDQLLLNDLKSFAEVMKQKIADMDVKLLITSLLDSASKWYTDLLSMISDTITLVVDTIEKFVPEQKIISEFKQIITGLIAELRKFELNTPSFTLPLTNLVVPSMMFRMDELQNFEIPTQIDIPEFTILGCYTIQANTISFDDIKQMINEPIEFIVNFEIKMLDMDAFFGDLTMNYLPTMPEITLPEITITELSLLTIPQVPLEKLLNTLQLPEIMLPRIPSEIMVPCFGKLYSEIRFNSPFYTFKTSAEIQNSTDNEMTPQLTALLTSQATSPSFEIFNYNLDSTARIAVPKMSRVVITETLKFNHVALGVEQQASIALYGLSAQAQAKTTVKVATAPYTADFVNSAFIAMEGGMSASLDTTYNHLVNLPIIGFRNDATLTQKAVVQQDGYTLTLTADNVGKLNSEEVSHNSKLLLKVTPGLVTMSLSGETDSELASLKLKHQMTAEAAIFRYFKFDIRNEAEASFIKNSLFVASGYANFYDLKVEFKANHDTEVHGGISGVLSNGINLVARPTKFFFDFQNKGNAKVYLFESLIAKLDLQNDYSAIFKPDSQQLNTVALARINQYKIFYNVTVGNNENQAGIFVALDGETNLDFLTSPINIPEFELPFIDFRTPAISDLNLYEQTGFKDILTTTEQTIDVDAKIVYKKSQFAPLVDVMGWIRIPSMGNLISELSFKSSIINLNVNAALYAEDDLTFRLGATTASVFDSLRAKLDGTTSLTTKRGIKLANSLSLENRHIEATVAKIDLPIFSLEANQNLVVDTKTKANAISNWRVKGEFNMPVIKAVGKVEADHSMKLEGTYEYISMESTTKANIDGTVLEQYVVLGIMDNEANLYLNADGLRSTFKVNADAKLNQEDIKLIGMDVNENLEVEASLSRVYAVLKFTSNNEANLFTFNTNGKYVAQATIDFAPMSSLTADIGIDLSQSSTLGDLIIVEKMVVDMTIANQKISSNAKFVSPLYTTNVVAEIEGNAPVYKVTLKSSATSAFVFLDYELDGSTTANFENEALGIMSKLVLTHTDLTMDVKYAVAQALSFSGHTLNVDITSPTFTDVNFLYAARSDGMSASVSIPSTGYLGINLSGRVPSPMSARLYCRYASDPETDVDILIIKSTPKDADKMNLQIAYNMEAPKVILSELKMRLPSIISTLTMFAEKYQITKNMEDLKNSVVDRVQEAYNAAINYDVTMSQLSIFFRNIFVQYQKTVQVLLDATVKLLRETHFKLPGSDEMTTLPEVLKKLTSSIATMLEKMIQVVYQNIEVYYNTLIEKFSDVKLRMPIGDAITGAQIVDQIKAAFKNIYDELVDLVKNMESLDTMLVKMGETLKAIVEKSQEFVDSVQSDYLEAVFLNINVLYLNLLTILNNVVDQLSALNMEQLNNTFGYIVDMFINAVEMLNTTVSRILQQTSEEAYVRASAGRLEIDLPFPFLQ